MTPESEPCVGTWYAGEHHPGAFLVTHLDAACGVIHLRSAAGSRVRMSFEAWRRRPLKPMLVGADATHARDRFEWYEPAIG